MVHLTKSNECARGEHEKCPGGKSVSHGVFGSR